MALASKEVFDEIDQMSAEDLRKITKEFLQMHDELLQYATQMPAEVRKIIVTRFVAILLTFM